MFNDDEEFFLDGDDMDEEAQLSLIEETKLRILEKIQEITKKCIENLKFKETEFSTNLSIVERHFAELRELSALELNDELTDDEIFAEIQRISRSVRPMSQEEIDNYQDEFDDFDEDSVEDILNDIMDSLGNIDPEPENKEENKKTGGFKKLNKNEDTSSESDDDLF